MKLANWKNLVEIVGITAIVASLIFVGIQIQQDRRVASSQVTLTALEAAVAMNTAIAEHAGIWVKARNQEVLSEIEIEIVEELIAAAQTRAYLQSLSYEQINGNDSIEFRNTGGPIMNFSIMLHENPGAQQIWLEKADRDDNYYKTLGRPEIPWIQFHNIVRHNLAELRK